MIDAITPTPQRSGASLTDAVQAGGNMGKQEFLQLLITQLRYQDPLNPSDPEDFAAQLAQFTSLEQLIQINETLGTQGAASAQLAQNINSGSAVNVIGKDVLASGEHVFVGEGGSSTATFGVSGDGGAATLHILREDGSEIGSAELGELRGGRHDLDISNYTKDLDPGAYRYRVEVVNGDGEPVDVTTFITARIDGLRYTPDGPVLVAAGVEIPLANVIEISGAKAGSDDEQEG